MRDLDVALAAIADRHAVVAHTEYRNDFERRQAVKQRRWRHRAATLHQPADALSDAREQRVAIARRCVIVTPVIGLERMLEERRECRGDEDVDVVHGLASLLCG